jgi:hypothetical protein
MNNLLKSAGHALANNYRYLASLMIECERRADLGESILQWDGPDDDDPLHQQMKSEVQDLCHAVVRCQLALQALADRDVPGLNCCINYRSSGVPFQELDPPGDYHETMERWGGDASDRLHQDRNC